MNENRWSGDDDDLTEEKIEEMVWNCYFPQMRFWTCFNLVGILFILALPFLIYLCDKILSPGWTQYLYHYSNSQLFLFLIILVISLASMFYIVTAKDKYRLEMVKWLSLAGAVMMWLSFFLFEKEIGYASITEKKLYWIIFICALLHIVACMRVFHAYKRL